MDARAAYDELCDDLAARNPEVTLTQMMGMPAVKADGKLVCGWVRSEEAMVFKLPDAATHAEALGLDGAHLFDPRLEASSAKPTTPGRKTGMPSASPGTNGRPFRQWVVVPAAHASAWPGLAAKAFRQRAHGR
jgi:hypothetical protein